MSEKSIGNVGARGRAGAFARCGESHLAPASARSGSEGLGGLARPGWPNLIATMRSHEGDSYAI